LFAVSVLSPQLYAEGVPYTDFTVTVTAEAQTSVTLNSSTFLGLSTISGQSNRVGGATSELVGVNFTWFLIEYAAWGENTSVTCTTSEGFSRTFNASGIWNNDTHCHILAHTQDGEVLGKVFQVWLVPVNVSTGDIVVYQSEDQLQMVSTITIGAQEPEPTQPPPTLPIGPEILLIGSVGVIILVAVVVVIYYQRKK
jgi:hypothetical protein